MTVEFRLYWTVSKKVEANIHLIVMKSAFYDLNFVIYDPVN